MLKKRNLLKSKRGITLIEQLLVLSLILIIFLVGYSLYLMGIKGFVYNADALDGQANVRIAMDHIIRSFRYSNTIKVDGSYLKTGEDTYYLSGDVLMVNRNQLAVGISEFVIFQPLPHLVYVRITSVPDSYGRSFSLQSWLTIRRL